MGEDQDIVELTRVSLHYKAVVDPCQNFGRSLNLNDRKPRQEVFVREVSASPPKHQPETGLVLLTAFLKANQTADYKRLLDMFMEMLKRLRQEPRRATLLPGENLLFKIPLFRRERDVFKKVIKRMAEPSFERQWGEGYKIHNRACEYFSS
jgi:hypothetical protein